MLDMQVMMLDTVASGVGSGCWAIAGNVGDGNGVSNDTWIGGSGIGSGGGGGVACSYDNDCHVCVFQPQQQIYDDGGCLDDECGGVLRVRGRGSRVYGSKARVCSKGRV